MGSIGLRSLIASGLFNLTSTHISVLKILYHLNRWIISASPYINVSQDDGFLFKIYLMVLTLDPSLWYMESYSRSWPIKALLFFLYYKNITLYFVIGFVNAFYFFLDFLFLVLNYIITLLNIGSFSMIFDTFLNLFLHLWDFCFCIFSLLLFFGSFLCWYLFFVTKL